MWITISAFGGMPTECSYELHDLEWGNGHGKTTLVNAYIFALTGRTLRGFEPRNVYAKPEELTFVELEGVPGLPIIRRILHPNGGTKLFLGPFGYHVDETQKRFEELCELKGYNLELAVACADVNILTADDLPADVIRKFLIRANVLQRDEYTTLKKKLTKLREQRANAERYAVTNMVLPPITVVPLNVAERDYVRRYEDAVATISVDIDTQKTCATCGRLYEPEQLDELQKRYKQALDLVTAWKEDAETLIVRQDEYNKQCRDVADTQRILDAAAQARADVQRLDIEIQKVLDTLKLLDAASATVELPEGVKVITEHVTGTGKVNSVCTLTYNGIPLRSVNRAKRIEICVQLLDRVRGLDFEKYPIILDNAEGVQGLTEVKNLVRLAVPQKTK